MYRILLFAFNSLYAGTVYSKNFILTVSTLKMPSVDDFQSSTNNFMTEIHNVHNYAIAGSLILRFVIAGFYCMPESFW